MVEIYKNEATNDPHKPTGRGRRPTYPFRDLAVGESFLTDVGIVKASAAANMHMKRHPGARFECDTQPDSRVRVKRVL